jgi:hypothetical protein
MAELVDDLTARSASQAELNLLQTNQPTHTTTIALANRQRVMCLVFVVGFGWLLVLPALLVLNVSAGKPRPVWA